MPKPAKSAVNFILFTILLDVVGFGIIIPVLPKLLAELQGVTVNEASKYGGYLITAFAIAQFIFSPIMGSLSDRFGRRPVLLLALFGLAVDYVILALAPSYAWLVFGRVFAGVCGASFTTALAYIADVSTDVDREKNFGLVGAAFGMGFIIGPLLGGVLGELGSRVPFYAAAGISFLNFAYGYFILPESLPKDKQRPFEWARANPIGTFKSLLKYKGLGPLFLAVFLLNLASHAVNSNWAYFTIFKFGWSEFMVGISLAAAGALIGLFQGVFAQKFKNYFGTGKSIFITMSCYALGFFLFSMASTTWMMFVFLIPFSMGSVWRPLLQSYLTSRVGDDQQGELQGGLASILSLTTIFGPLIMTGVFYRTTQEDAALYLPGSPFLLAAILSIFALILAYGTLRRVER